MTIRVLVIDDSATMRAILMSRLSNEPDIAVVGAAASAAEGRELIKQLNPDVVTLDIEMPGMNGLEFLEKLMRLRPTPVIVVSGSTEAGNATTAHALALGAVHCYAKCDRNGGLPLNDNGRLANLVREAAEVRFRPARPAPVSAAPGLAIDPASIRLIAIGASTGGVEALQVLLRGFGPDCPPTLVVQHVHARFAPAIAGTLDQASGARVLLAEPDLPLQRGHVYLAPGDRHLSVGGMTQLHTKLRDGELVSGHRPSVDVLFHSVAQRVGAGAAGILLTGMGADGAEGLLAMARAGAPTIAQDEASCTVFGMPRAAIALGAARAVLPLQGIAGQVLGTREATRAA